MTKDCIQADSSSRTAVGLALVHLAFEPRDADVRRLAFNLPSKLMRLQPKLCARIYREALQSWLKTEDEKRKTVKAKSVEDEVVVSSKSNYIGRLLSSVFVADETSDRGVLQDMAVDYLVLAHHPEITESAQTSWIGLVQSVGLDPATIAAEKRDRISKLLWSTASAPPEVCLSRA